MSEGATRSEQLTYLIANYNCGEFVSDCLASLRAQTDTGWWAIVADDASTDASLERIRPLLDERVRLLVNERNLGYIATLERLIAEATTDIVAILDADDALETVATAQLLVAHTREPRAGLVYSRYAEYDTTLTVLLGVHGGAVPLGGTAIIDGPVGAIRSFRRSAYARTAGLDPGMLYAEDRDLVYQLEELSPPHFIDAVLYRYRRVPGSQTGDPEKQEIGLRNTRRARRAALERRRVRGLARLAAECNVGCDYVADSRRFSRPVRAVAYQVAAIAAMVWRLCGAAPPRDPGRLEGRNGSVISNDRQPTA